MSHLSEEDLILLHYGEAEVPAEARAHLAECAECRAAQTSLEQALDVVQAPVPEPGDDFGARMWARLAPRLVPERRVLRFPGVRSWAALLAAAAALVAAFETGRRLAPLPAPQASPSASSPVRERILVVAVGDHLRRSQMVLVELVNAKDATPLDVRRERATVEDLLADNRLYRQTAAVAGEHGVEDVLDELERVLLELANGPDTLSSQAVTELKQRIESKGILFKVRVLGSQMRDREDTSVRRRGAVKS